MEIKHSGILYVWKINKKGDISKRTIVEFIEKKNGAGEYLDLRSLQTIRALTRGNQAIIVNRAVGTKDKDRLVSSEPIALSLLCEDCSALENFVSSEEMARNSKIDCALEVFDSKRRIKTEKHNIPIRVGK